ncbi:auxin-responsive protein IAA11 isoform X1 [Neltuma alba]|uniref:auxin-responsive protein IAA11-like isoform X1 n=1 Tax=Neltuma alba TaxID=207710 RepID=UPI0010A4836C|nr:auxin-responsive protein IAA11-like isoform X1 [Prosopis alba]XP_028794555.1 auxin-responsive protein IAA11-like isoform X1 [Prosopis alba]
MQGDSSPRSMLTESKEDNLVLSSEDSSCPDESELELGLGLSLSHPRLKSQPPPTTQYARILTAMDFSSSASSSASSSSPNATAGTKRAADSLVASNGPSQVVGWPPLRAYRMNSFNNNHSKSPATEAKGNQTAARKATDNGSNKNNSIAKEEAHIRRSLFVKVNMDGTPIGRKVDLSAHGSYENLARALEDMFNEPATKAGLNGEDRGIVVGAKKRHLNLLDESSNFVLTYEDKEGDWMLVGDVPWDMFLNSVRRLRIMRTSEANGLAPRLEEKKSRLRS